MRVMADGAKKHHQALSTHMLDAAMCVLHVFSVSALAPPARLAAFLAHLQSAMAGRALDF
jgi:hypothetical protein